MSLSRTTKGEIESTQSEKPNCSSDLSCIRADNEFMELLWENGQIAMQDQSNRPRKTSFFTALPSHISRVREKETEDAIIPKVEKLKGIESMANDFSTYAPSDNTGLHAQDDDMVPWINNPIEDSFHDDYCQEFLNEFLEVNHSSLCGRSNATPSDRSNGFGQMPRDSDDVDDILDSKVFARDSEPSKIRTSQLFQLSQQCQSVVPSTKSGATSIGVNRTSKTHPGLCEALLNTRFPKQDVARLKPSSSGVGVMNFSQFGRPAALAKSSLLNVDGLRSSEKASTSVSSNPMQSMVSESTSGLNSVCAIREQMASVVAKVELRPSAKPLKEVISIEQSEAICQENPNNKNTCDHNSLHEHIQSSGFTASVTIGGHEIRKGPEAIVASSSVCSVNSSEAVANDPIHREKRKNREEASEYQSEDIEEDSVRLKKTTSGRDSMAKRSRATEVHNLSERRRRDRINEKMRALQELIPHCNKVDKASMLDEAIEYLKTLRMQVQMMSMGSGLCMPPMAMPAGMQQMRAHPMAHFWPMCVGMGMGNGLGYGMGMYDINGVPRFPLVPFQPVHEPQFSFPSIPGAPGLLGMPGSTSLQMFGGIPGQGLPPVWVPPLPPLSSSSGLSVNGCSMPEVSGITTSPVPTADIAPTSSLKDQQHQNLNLDTAQKKDIYSVKECFKQSSLVRTSDQTLRDSGIEALNSITGSGNTSNCATDSYD